jgi:hypothetical protein
VPGLPPEPPSSTTSPTRESAGGHAKPAASQPPAATPPAVAPVPTPDAAPAPAASDGPKHAPKKRTSRRSTAKPAAQRTPTPRRSRAEEPLETPAPAPKPAPDPVTVVADDVAVTSRSPNAESSDDARPEVVVVPSLAKAPVAAKAGPGPDDATDVLHRLVPEGESPEPLDDPADLRARLARTAALKKPGSRERQEEREALQDGSSEQ